MLSKLKYCLPHILRTVYNFTYGILAWGIPNAMHIIYISGKKRVILLSKYNEHTNSLYKDFKLLKVNDIYNLRVLNFYHQLMNEQLPFFYSIPMVTNTKKN